MTVAGIYGIDLFKIVGCSINAEGSQSHKMGNHIMSSSRSLDKWKDE